MKYVSSGRLPYQITRYWDHIKYAQNTVKPKHNLPMSWRTKRHDSHTSAARISQFRKKKTLLVSQGPTSGRGSCSHVNRWDRPTNRPTYSTSATARNATADSANRITKPDQCPFASF